MAALTRYAFTEVSETALSHRLRELENSISLALRHTSTLPKMGATPLTEILPVIAGMWECAGERPWTWLASNTFPKFVFFFFSPFDRSYNKRSRYHRLNLRRLKYACAFKFRKIFYRDRCGRFAPPPPQVVLFEILYIKYNRFPK